MLLYFSTLFCTAVVLLLAKMIYGVSTLAFINQCFLYGLAILAAGICVFIYQTGFFHFFFKGFQQIYQFIVPKPKILLREEERLANDVWWKERRSRMLNNAKKILLGIGTGSILISLTYLFFYYGKNF
ncbi:DUF3899 domain-containing protein [Parageobacillus thermoglucosidasius]|uniref:DUF3899 domain-containing protein n=3 Tax=Anoxybacillaceae TaxID=3120669 RepID=A0AB38R5C5_PARTM|nr:DUF3899 domain-containing protein [Parageobacillus thermoglucosidasius]KYD17204.1 hypothetical protein B4168_1604 [Anoxybacillus flavithermus]REK59572.1 MAG: DUF3899 domain-containing protein [Geobacillus sp.]AEH48204.1 hypothetical protein Geoth_2277 [Parageobacillus thermoglucosidasius C56-YS93]ALF10566.1 hypothetical protein AOT13_11390 [Parageobacillus thermoglucosidasius]ANZ30645.1 hypothetical protein BCV53_11405 [Parageobacillus thermoglucosidasius]